MKKRLLSLLLLPLLAGCPTLGKATQPKAPIDAEAVAPLWDAVLLRYRGMTEGTITPPAPPLLDSWLLDAELLQGIIDKALNKPE